MLRPLSLLPLALLFAVSCSDSIDKPAARGKKSGSVAPGAGNAADGSSEADTTSPKRVVAARRLNNREYAATVRDLLGTSLNPADNFPADPIGLNFDNVGASLSVSPVLGKLFYSSAETLAGEIKGAESPGSHGVYGPDRNLPSEFCRYIRTQSLAAAPECRGSGFHHEPIQSAVDWDPRRVCAVHRHATLGLALLPLPMRVSG